MTSLIVDIIFIVKSIKYHEILSDTTYTVKKR